VPPGPLSEELVTCHPERSEGRAFSEAMLKMVKLDIDELERAAASEARL
jgi:hypothetical protein